MKNCSWILILLLECSISLAYSQSKTDLQSLYENGRITSLQRSITMSDIPDKKALHIGAAKAEGLAVLEGITFKEGTIELEMKGRDLFQKSFLGVAFNLRKDGSYEVVYFRPFNFRATDPVRRSHAVQYEYMPGNDWKSLRANSPGVYEKEIESAPDPEAWFHIRLVVTAAEIKAYVNYAGIPSLSVKRLPVSTVGKVALMCGDQSDGLFANVVILKDTIDDKF